MATVAYMSQKSAKTSSHSLRLLIKSSISSKALITLQYVVEIDEEGGIQFIHEHR